MGFFDIFSGGPFDLDGDGKTDGGEMALGFMMLDEFEREERDRKKQEFLDELLLNAALEGFEYSDEEIQDIMEDSEQLGLFG